METTRTDRSWSQDDEWSPEEVAHAPLRPMERSGVELNQLNRYGFMLAMLALCALLSTWSRIDLRATSLGLDEARGEYSTAQSEQARLRLELASLSDPGWLSGAASALLLEGSVPVIDIKTQNSPR